MSAKPESAPAEPEVLFHEAECGGYAADLERLAELAATARRPVVDLGAGAGRVSLHLARRGAGVLAIESSPVLARHLAATAAAEALAVEVVAGDVLGAGLEPASADLVLATMQFLALFGPPARARLLGRIAPALVPGGRLAATVLADHAEVASEPGAAVPIPDVRESDGWIFSSLPLAVTEDDERLVVERLRQSVSPSGELTEERSSDVLHALDADRLAAEAAGAGLAELERERLPDDGLHADSTLIVLERR